MCSYLNFMALNYSDFKIVVVSDKLNGKDFEIGNLNFILFDYC